MHNQMKQLDGTIGQVRFHYGMLNQTKFETVPNSLTVMRLQYEFTKEKRADLKLTLPVIFLLCGSDC